MQDAGVQRLPDAGLGTEQKQEFAMLRCTYCHTLPVTLSVLVLISNDRMHIGNSRSGAGRLGIVPMCASHGLVNTGAAHLKSTDSCVAAP
jgi:hypothetical protein